MNLANLLLRNLFKLQPDEASFEKRGFHLGDTFKRERLEKAILIFIKGFNMALKETDTTLLLDRLEDQFDEHHVGFAFEGVGFCYCLNDLVSPTSKSSLQHLAEQLAEKHDYIITVGAGFVFGRLPFFSHKLEKLMTKLNPKIGWCLADGYGFHQGFFHHQEYIYGQQSYPRHLPEYSRAVFDSGIGRSIWWVTCADVQKIRQIINSFSPERRPELWCGIGMAAGYAGGIMDHEVLDLLIAADSYSVDFLSGLPFIAEMRTKGGNPSEWTNKVCQIALNRSALETANLLREQLNELEAKWMVSDIDKMKYGYTKLRDKLRLLLKTGDKLNFENLNLF